MRKLNKTSEDVIPALKLHWLNCVAEVNLIFLLAIAGSRRGKQGWSTSRKGVDLAVLCQQVRQQSSHRASHVSCGGDSQDTMP